MLYCPYFRVRVAQGETHDLQLQRRHTNCKLFSRRPFAFSLVLLVFRMVITSIPSAIALSQRKIGAISIATVAATIALYVLYDKVARAPRSIRHIPQINVLKLLKALLWTRMPIRKIVEQVTMPSVEQGLYTVKPEGLTGET